MVITPPAMVNAYVTNHPLTTVYLNGEAVEGIGLPANLALRRSRGSVRLCESRAVLVGPQTRTISYVYR